jgi:hypothetical protein
MSAFFVPRSKDAWPPAVFPETNASVMRNTTSIAGSARKVVAGVRMHAALFSRNWSARPESNAR